jgi:hypothetical protein
MIPILFSGYCLPMHISLKEKEAYKSELIYKPFSIFLIKKNSFKLNNLNLYLFFYKQYLISPIGELSWLP